VNNIRGVKVGVLYGDLSREYIYCKCVRRRCSRALWNYKSWFNVVGWIEIDYVISMWLVNVFGQCRC